MNFSQSELQGLWTQAGGDSAVAPLMAAVAMAESGGNSDASNPDSGACGLWQIHPAESGCTDPFTNAQQAVRKYNSQGLGAWEAYTNGSYKRYAGNIATDNTETTSSTCITFNTLGNCWDAVVGLLSVILGVAMVTAGIGIVIYSNDTVKQAAKTAILIAPK